MAVEVTVRFAGTLIDAVVVAPGCSFRLGTAPGVDVAIPGLISFPLIDSTGLIRLPAGIPALRNDGTRLADIAPLALTGDAALTMSIGHVEITLAVAKATAPLSRPRIDRRAWPYLALALVAHLGVWATAMTREVPDAPLQRLVHARLAKKPIPPPPPPRERRESGVAMPLQEGRMGKRDGDRADGQYAMPGRGFAGITAEQIQGLIGTADLGRALADADGPAGPQMEPDATLFGGARRFDPSTRPGFESVKTGRYATVAHGRGAGDDYHLSGETTVEVELCATKACVANGAFDRASVHSWIAPHASDFRACFDGTQSVLVDFTIANGVVHGARGRGATGKCAAAVVSGIAFPHTDGTTRVRYEVIYRT